MYLFPALFALVVTPSLCKGQHRSIGHVFPQDPYIEVGSDIEVVCQTLTHDKVYWTLNGTRIDGSLSKAINSSHTVLSLTNFTLPRAVLQCHSEDTQYVIAAKPHKISCIWYYHEYHAGEGVPHLLTCSWEHQKHPESQKKINYTVLCAAAENDTCNSQDTTCTFNDTHLSGLIAFRQNFSVTVIAKTADWEVSSYSEFYSDHIIKINRPRLEVTTFPDRLLVWWSRTHKSEKSHCQVKYSKAVNERTPELVHNETLDPSTEGKVTIEDVESCSNYTFAVRCALENALSSDWSEEKIVLTKLNSEVHIPRMHYDNSATPGGDISTSQEKDVELRLWRTVAEPNKNGVRKVRVMWTGIPSTCQDTLYYTIKQTGEKDACTCGNSACDVDVNQDAHNISLIIFNNKFQLVEDSIYVPAIGESLPQVTDIQTSTLDGVILVCWKAPDQPVSGYMIHYTHDGNHCFWKESKYTNATLFDLLDGKAYNITVTPLFDNKTGHGTRAPQTCSRVRGPGIVTINVQTNAKSALVSWNVIPQDVCSGAVVNYLIFYSTEKGPQRNVTVGSPKQHVSLKDLSPNTQYNIYVEAIALTGSAKSKVWLFKTKTFDQTLITAITVCGSITIVLVLSLGLCCATQWKKFKDKLVPNPGLSSVALWPSHRQVNSETCLFPPFSNPSESECVRVYTEEPQRTSTSPLTVGCNIDPATDQDYTDLAGVPAPDVENENPVEPVETQHLSSQGEFTSLLPPDNSLLSPYRSQNSVETPAPRTSKQCKQVPVKQKEKTPPLTVYVTLDMFEQGQGR